jgi:hypothetical protein
MSLLETCPNEILQAIASHVSLSDVLNIRLVCSRLEASVRNYIALRYFTNLRAPYSEEGLRYLSQKTRCQCFIRELHSMTIKFFQTPLYYLDHMDPSRLRRLHRDLIESSWHNSEPQGVNIMRRLDQWSTYRSFYKAQRRMFERYADLSLLQEVMSSLKTSRTILNIEFKETTDINPSACGEDIHDLMELIYAANIPRISQSMRLYHMSVQAGKTVGMVAIK